MLSIHITDVPKLAVSNRSECDRAFAGDSRLCWSQDIIDILHLSHTGRLQMRRCARIEPLCCILEPSLQLNRCRTLRDSAQMSRGCARWRATLSRLARRMV